MFDVAELYFPEEKVIIEMDSNYRGHKVTGINIDFERPDYIIVTCGNLHHRLKPMAAKLIQKDAQQLNW